MITYEIKKKDKDVNKIEILKKGLEANINFFDLAKEIRKETKMRTEIQSDRALNQAMTENIRRNYTWVKKFTPDQLKTIALYAVKMQIIEDCNTDLKTLKKNFDTYQKEIPEIKAALGITEYTQAEYALDEARDSKDVAGAAFKKAMKKAPETPHEKKSKKS